MRNFLATLALLAIAFTTPAFAHAQVKSAVPAVDSSGPAPAVLEIGFNETVNLQFSSVVLLAPGGTPVETGPLTAIGDGSTVSLPISGEMAPGAYTVEWKVLSADGHKLNGTYSFTVTP